MINVFPPKIVTPPYPIGLLFGKTGLYLSTPLPTKLMFFIQVANCVDLSLK
jgi:hypothetical protein